MSNSFFSFKKFTVCQDKCAMKVGTDGVLLGAWAPVGDARNILDVGTGTGLIALQLAQRNAYATLTALEIDAAAARQAQENILASPWADRIQVVCDDFCTYLPDEKFDLVVSNPPYFVDALKCPDKQRNMARHAEGLNYECLFRRLPAMLAPEGAFSLVIPVEVLADVMEAAGRHGWWLLHRTNVFTKQGKPCRRILLCFVLRQVTYREDALYIEGPDGYTPEYVALTREFYLKM